MTCRPEQEAAAARPRPHPSCPRDTRGTPGHGPLTALLTALLVAGALVPAQPRGFQLLVLAALLVALGAVGRRGARWLLPEEGALSRAVAGFSMAVAAAALPAIGLGHLGVLRPSWFLLAEVAILLLALLVPASGEPPPAGFVGIAPLAPAWPARLVRFEREAERVLLLAAAGAFIAMAALLAHRIRYTPAGHFAFDDISYHLSAVATWMRHGDLRMIKFSYGDTSTAFYPILAEICSWVLLAPLRDSDFLARWTQLPFAVFSWVAIAALARRLGLSRRGAVLAVLLYATLYRVYPMLALSAGNDHTASFFTLASLDGALALARRPRPGAAVATGLALGLLVATKYIGLLFAPAVLAAAAAAALARGELRAALRWASGRRTLALLLAIVAGVAAVAGGYTYLRNAWTTGNPVFPAPVRVLGFEVLPGWEVVTLAHRRHAPEFALRLPWFFLRRDLFGPLFPYTLLPAALLAPLVALVRRRPWERRVEAAAVLALPVVFFLQFLYLMHDHRDVRYFLAGLALAALAVAWLTEQLPVWAAFPLRALLALLACHQMARRLALGPGKEIAFLAVAVALAALALRYGGAARPRLASPRSRRRWAVAGLAVLALAALGAGGTVERYQERKLRRLPAALALERAAGPRGAVVACAGHNQPYLFFGSRLQNDVQYVPTTWALGSQYYRWGGDVDFPYRQGTARRWRHILKAYGVGFLVLERSRDEGPERGWVLERPDLFRRIYNDGVMEVWQVVRPGEALLLRPAHGPG